MLLLVLATVNAKLLQSAHLMLLLEETVEILAMQDPNESKVEEYKVFIVLISLLFNNKTLLKFTLYYSIFYYKNIYNNA